MRGLAARFARRRVACALSGAVALGAVLAAPHAARTEPATYDLDPEHLTVGFLVQHLGYASVLGVFLKAAGSYRFDEGTRELADLAVTVDTASVSTSHRERDEHLRSADFLNSRKYPQMAFTASAVRPTGERTFDVDGQLELLGQARPLTLHAAWNKSAAYPFDRNPYVMGVSARGSFKRSAYGMTYGVDNDWVGDEVEIIIEFEARRRE